MSVEFAVDGFVDVLRDFVLRLLSTQFLYMIKTGLFHVCIGIVHQSTISAMHCRYQYVAKGITQSRRKEKGVK